MAKAFAAARPETPAPITQTCFGLTMCRSFPLLQSADIPHAFRKSAMRYQDKVAAKALVVGLRRQKIHFVIRRDAYNLGRIGEVMQFVEQGLKLLHGRHPEQRARRLVGLVEI